MEKSLFIELVVKYFASYILRLTTFINDKEGTQRYWFAEMLDKQYTPDLKWTNISINDRAVMADVVALDANFPLKKRGRLSTASGEITKLATKRTLNETQMSEIIRLQDSRFGTETQIAQILFADTKAVVVSIWERIEYMYLQGLSSGFYAVEQENNVGLSEIRVNLGLPESQRFGAVVKWSDPLAKPIDDIERVLQNQTDNNKRKSAAIMMDRSTWFAFRSNEQVKQYIAGYLRYQIADNLATPQLEVVNEFLSKEYGLTIVIVDRSVVFEKNNQEQSFNCWTPNAVVFVPQLRGIGKLFHSTLAAEAFPDETRSQQKVDGYIIVQKYSERGDTPFEVTSSQALAVPVPDMFNVWILDTEEAEDTSDASQTEGDDSINIFGGSIVSKTKVINALNSMGVTVASNSTDKNIIKKVNALSDEQKEQLQFALEIPVVVVEDDNTVTTNSTTLSATATPATGKTIASTLWSKVSGGAATITTAAALTTTVTGLVEGVYVFKLTATDSAGTVSSDTVTITVDLP